ncbi:MAG: hypothetical protein ACREMD_00750 [Gemmatimonadota bacterium]
MKNDLAVLSLLALTGGFLFTHLCHYTSYRASRAETQRLLFLSACWGVGLLVLSRLMDLTIRKLCPGIYGVGADLWSIFVPQDIPGLALFSGAFLLGLILPWALNGFWPAPLSKKVRAHVSRQVIKKYGSDMERLLYNSIDQVIPVAITLKSHKVYIGWPIWVPRLTTELEDLSLLPAVSGYRDPETKRLELTTRYQGVYETPFLEAHSLSATDFAVIIRLEEIVSANLFSTQIDQAVFQIPDETAPSGD